jgi:hypothetical protein
VQVREYCSLCWNRKLIHRRFPYNAQVKNRLRDIGIYGHLWPTDSRDEIVFCEKCYNGILWRLENDPPWRLKHRVPGSAYSNFR